ADHDGRNDPATITATQVFDGGRWYAHSSTVVGSFPTVRAGRGACLGAPDTGLAADTVFDPPTP
ncbi:hypothetical protein ABZ943_38915, partial [Streptomyces rubiginosohelvolus]